VSVPNDGRAVRNSIEIRVVRRSGAAPSGVERLTLEEVRRLFSPLPDTRYAFGETDEGGRNRLSSFAAQNHCAFNQYPDGRLYFTRLPDAEIC
jgi:hypothetical protein